MFIFIWVTLLFSVGSTNAYTGTVPGGKQHCKHNYCITLSERAIIAEAGLCVIILCSFSTEFEPTSAIWYKCDPPKQTHVESDTPIFHSSNNENVQPEFKGRVSLLEPDLSLKNCSIIINDLKMSDSGSYQLRVVSNKYGKMDGFSFPFKATVTVTDLIQKPTVMIPPLREGHQTTLSCTAPGLCSGSVPKITWMWRGAGENNSQITRNITAFKTENLTAVAQRHSSSFTFNPFAKHSGREVTCKVSFRGKMTTEVTATLKVAYIKITGKKTLKEGDVLSLVCRAEGFSPSLITWTQLGSNKNLRDWIKSDPENNVGTAILIIPNMTTEHSGQYICTAKHLNTTLTSDVNVTFLPKILKSSGCEIQSEVLTCVCISQGVPLPTIKWPLLENHTEYYVLITVCNRTVNSTVILTIKQHSNTVVKCVSTNENGEVPHNLTIISSERQKAGHHGPGLLLMIAVAVSLVNVFLTILLILFWCSRKKVKLNQEDRTYMSLQKRDISPVYDVISQFQNQQVSSSM